METGCTLINPNYLSYTMVAVASSYSSICYHTVTDTKYKFCSQNVDPYLDPH